MSEYFEATMKEKEFSSVAFFIRDYNKHRLANKGKWIGFDGVVQGIRTQVKSTGTRTQILRLNGVKYSTLMDRPVTAWRDEFEEAFDHALGNAPEKVS